MANKILLLTMVLLLVVLVINIQLSREIINWLPGFRIRLLLLLTLWLLPGIGAVLVYRYVQPGWFDHEPGDAGNQSTISSGLLAVDAIFNPGSRHVLEAKKRSQITIQMEGEMFDRELPDFIDIHEDDNPGHHTTVAGDNSETGKEN